MHESKIFVILFNNSVLKGSKTRFFEMLFNNALTIMHIVSGRFTRTSKQKMLYQMFEIFIINKEIITSII